MILNRSGTVGEFFGHDVFWAKNAADLVDRSELTVVSVRSQDWQGLEFDSRGKLVISVIVGVPLRALPPRSQRALPNAAAELRPSYAPWLAGTGTSEADRRDAVHLLSAIGTCEAVASEHHLNLMTATVGAGHAYSALMAKALIDFLVESGVHRSIAGRAAEGMIGGASPSPLIAGKMVEVAQTVQRFIDYHGTTAAGLQAALTGGFDDAVKGGFRAGTKRAKQMSQGF